MHLLLDLSGLEYCKAPGCSQRPHLCTVSHRMAASPPSGVAYRGTLSALSLSHRPQRLAQRIAPGSGGPKHCSLCWDRFAKGRRAGRHELQDPPGLLRAHAIPQEDIEDCLGDAFEQTGPPPTYVTAPGRIVAGKTSRYPLLLQQLCLLQQPLGATACRICAYLAGL